MISIISLEITPTEMELCAKQMLAKNLKFGQIIKKDAFRRNA